MRDSLAAALSEPFTSFRHSLFFFFGLGLVIDRRVAQSGSHRIDDRFQQPNQGRKLRVRQTAD